MKKHSIIMISVAAVILLLCTGCRKIDTALPEKPIAFHTGTFVNPNDPEDTYLSIEYNGRTYIGYGTLKGKIDGNDIDKCLGYIVQENEIMEDVRVFTLTSDTDTNYLIRLFIDGFMNPPDFFRAVDTVGKEIEAPDFIDDLEYEYWR